MPKYNDFELDVQTTIQQVVKSITVETVPVCPIAPLKTTKNDTCIMTARKDTCIK